MPDLIIRPARSRDFDAVAALLKRSYSRQLAADYPDDLLIRALPLLTRPRPDLLSAPSYLVALRDGALLACGGWTRAAPQGGTGAGDVGHIRHVASDPDHLRQGIAGALIGAAIDQARDAGIRLLCCLSTRGAVPFYRALGFVGAAEIDLRLQPGLYFPAVEMRLALN
jgi:GNAT superfamily N-acetyltransferase